MNIFTILAILGSIAIIIDLLFTKQSIKYYKVLAIIGWSTVLAINLIVGLFTLFS